MDDHGAANLLEDRWDARAVEGLDEPGLLLYRSNLLGADKRITNYGGGNTSAKVTEKDPLTGEASEVLWVKGSGGDVGTMKRDGFATLYMDKLQALKGLYRGPDHEDEMVGYLPHCTFNLNPRAASIDTPLHAFVPYRHVDHMHPDAAIAIAATANSQEWTREIWGEEIGWLPWRRPGFELGLWLERFVAENPNAKGVLLASHGLFTWGATSYDCYRQTLDTINKAIVWLAARTGGRPAFGGARMPQQAPDDRRATAARLMPALRGLISADQPKIGHFDDSAPVLEFVDSRKMEDLAALGTSCPDHFLRTKIRPLVVDAGTSPAALQDRITDYRHDYAGYYERCRHPDSPAQRDPNPVVYLVPGVGMITFAKDKPTARIAGEFYVNAINVMRGASTVDAYVGLPEQEAFDIEYWLLEEAKLRRMPKPRPLTGKVALVTGGGGGIGRAIADRLLQEGACVVLADIDAAALDNAGQDLSGRHGEDQVRTVTMDVTDETAVGRSFQDAQVAYGGIDIVVSNAGISSASPVEDTELSMWQRNIDILTTGYFLVAREAFRTMKAQGLGGSIVFIASKNALAASPNASAYCTAKAAEVHLARCLALEGADSGIRVNVINPDAVLQGSKIWQGEWRAQRAAAYNLAPDQLEEHYRMRSLLKRSVLPADVAETAYFLASDMSAKSTGNIINVDAGNAQSFTR